MTDSDPADRTGDKPDATADGTANGGARSSGAVLAPAEDPDFPNRSLRDFAVAAAFWTWLPIRVEPPQKRADLGRSRYMFPLIGLLLGILPAFVFALATWLHLGGFAAAIMALAALMALTGGRAEIATAAVFEAAGRSRSRETRAKILTETRPGYYGVFAVFMLVLIKLALLGSVGGAWDAACVIVAAAAGSRGAAAVVSWFADTMDGDRMGGLELEPGRDMVWAAALAMALMVWLLLWFWSGLIAVPVALLAAGGAFAGARALFGGVPIYGVGLIQQAAEVSILLVAVAYF